MSDIKGNLCGGMIASDRDSYVSDTALSTPL